MKKITFLMIGLIFSLVTFASQLVLIPTGSLDLTKDAFKRNDLTIHFYNNDFVIASAASTAPKGSIILDKQAWVDEGMDYFILYFNRQEKDEYIRTVAKTAKILHQGKDFLVVSTAEQDEPQLYPAIHGGIIHITRSVARLNSNSFHYNKENLGPRDDIFTMMSQVNADSLQGFVQHLQDYGTRNAHKTGSFEAQDWLLAKFQSYGLDAELHDFYMSGGPASDNVIATLTGTLYPDEYVVLGGHYDSFTYSGLEPGADDNATGAAGILEAARILSQYQFDRSIIFATWSGEEYGLFGSEAWANEAAGNGMNILGYFNIDMAGYLLTGDEIHTDIIAPSSANELRQFYKDVCAIYLPDFQIFDGSLTGGDSDHTSFNNAGYQGIFPFEDSQNYSPYIHTPGDTIGTSVNNFEQLAVFVQAVIANVVTMADELATPENLAADAGDSEVVLNWDGLESVDYYNIYRDAETIPYSTSYETSYTDTNVENGTPYSYYVTAIFLNTGEESGPSNLVTAIPMFPISLPFSDDFETNAPYWTPEDSWGLESTIFHSSTYAISESPVGEYTSDMNASMTLEPLDFRGSVTARVSFWTRYRIEDEYDYMYLEASRDGISFDQLASFTGDQLAWAQLSYSLDNYISDSSVTLRFRFTSDTYEEMEGMFIDDFEVTVSGVGVNESTDHSAGTALLFYPNPVNNIASASFSIEKPGEVRLEIYDVSGRLVKSYSDYRMEAGPQQLKIDISGIQAGIYCGILESEGNKASRKLVISR